MPDAAQPKVRPTAPAAFPMENLPSLRQLHYLVAVAELRHFTRAAAACSVTQPTLSAGIAELESLLGARLLERGRAQVLLTPLGAEVVQRAQDLLRAANELREHVRSQAEPLATTVRLGAIPTIAPFVLPEMIRQIRQQHSQLRVAPREDTSAQLVERLRDGRLDAAILALPYPLEGLEVAAVAEDELVLAAARGDDHGADGRLWPEKLLLLEEGHCLRDHTLVACGAAGLAGAPRRLGPLGGDVEASSLLTLLQMVAGGFGSALIPAMALGHGLVEASGLQVRRLVPAPSRGIALVWRPTYPRQEAMQVLQRALKAAVDRGAGDAERRATAAV